MKRIPQDCTFDQLKFNKLLIASGKYYSLDLKSATVSFPIELIMDLLKTKLPTDYLDAWEDITVGHPYDYKREKIFYSCANPMGGYSSFNSFALAHHYIVYYCCRVLGNSWKTLPYALLGDDIVICDKSVS